MNEHLYWVENQSADVSLFHLFFNICVVLNKRDVVFVSSDTLKVHIQEFLW